jgi:hypothetical protein
MTPNAATRSLAARAVRALVVASAIGCGHGSPTSPSSTAGASGAPGFPVAPPAGASPVFTVSPIDAPGPNSLTALGNLNPPGHVLPTDHVYFYQGDLSTNNPFGSAGTRNVYAPTRSAVEIMLSSGTEAKVWFIVTPTFLYYLDHLTPRPGLAVGQIVNAGDIVGTSTETLDLGAYDYGTTLGGFVTPARYPDQTLHCVSPWKYFAEPLRSQLYSEIYRSPSAPDKDGKIDFDIAGRLAGAWFDPSVPMTGDSSGPTGWPKTVAFVYDYYDPSQVRISIGGTIAPAGVWAIDPSAPRPADVSVASGKVSYRLLYTDDSAAEAGLMIVQMVSDARIEIEVFMGSTAATADFDGGAYVWVR